MNLKDILAPVSHEMGQLENYMVEYLLTPNEPTNDIIRHIFASGGKRVRPALFFTVAQAIGYKGENLYPIAAVCEYIHTASLLHDDVIDDSTLRRGRKTTNSIWGDASAVLSGDLIYSAACRLMVKTGSLPLIDTFAECIRYMSESELFQLELLWNVNVTREQYEKVIEGKTACLFAASCETPLFLSPEFKEDRVLQHAFQQYGTHLGYAFQLADDLLDYTSDKSTLGKPTLADLKEGKSTLPILLGSSQDNVAGKELEILSKQILDSAETTEEMEEKLLELVEASGGLKLATQEAMNRAEKAIQSLEVAKKQLKNTEPIEKLESLAMFVVERNK